MPSYWSLTCERFCRGRFVGKRLLHCAPLGDNGQGARRHPLCSFSLCFLLLGEERRRRLLQRRRVPPHRAQASKREAVHGQILQPEGCFSPPTAHHPTFARAFLGCEPCRRHHCMPCRAASALPANDYITIRVVPVLTPNVRSALRSRATRKCTPSCSARSANT